MGKADDELTIDDLARRVGMTVRNIRAHQSRGLLGPPALRGRTGYYGAEHVARLELVKDLQAEGLNLEAIRQILDRTPGSSVAEVLGFTRAAVEPFSDEEPEIVDLTALIERWGEEATPQILARVIELGLLRPFGEERVEVVSPRLLAAADELTRLGVPLAAGIDVVEVLARHSKSIAKAYVALFIDNVLRPMQENEPDAVDWGEISEAMGSLRPLATQAVVAVFQMEMTVQVEKALERELSRMGGESSRRSRRR